MAGSYESEEATSPTVRWPLLPLARRIVLAFFLWESGTGWETTREQLDWLARWAASHDGGFPIELALRLALKLAALVAAGSAAAVLARIAVAAPRVPRRASAARVDEQGLRAGDRLVVSRQDVARVEVATDADLGFALVVTTRSGAVVRIPQRTERSARALSDALAPRATGGALVFEGVSGARSRQSRDAGLAVLGVVAMCAFFYLLHWLIDVPAGWGWIRGWQVEIRYTPAWWVSVASVFNFAFIGAALAAALGPFARRLRGGSVTVGPAGLETPDGVVPPVAVAGATPGAMSDVEVALHDGKKVRLAFGPERALVERDLFVARVRELMAAPAQPAYSAAETSGVRVAQALAETAADEEPEVAAEAPRARRVR